MITSSHVMRAQERTHTRACGVVVSSFTPLPPPSHPPPSSVDGRGLMLTSNSRECTP